MSVSNLQQPQRAAASTSGHARSGLSLVLLCLLTACNHRAASNKAIDVCALALEPVSTLLQRVPTSTGESRAPSAGHCQFTTNDGQNGARRVGVTVMTSASMDPDDVSRSARLMLAEAEQTFGDPGTTEFAALAKLAVTFNSAPGKARQIVIGERGVLMEIGLDSEGFRQDQVATLVSELRSRVLASKPSMP